MDDSGAVISYPPAAFAGLVRALREDQIPVVSFEDLLRGQDGVVLTFDDGMKSVFTEALPVLRNFAVPAHLFLTTGAVGGTNEWPSQLPGSPVFPMMSWDEVGACLEAGITVESHTVNHPDMRELTKAEIEEECEQADETIAERLGVVPTLMAYPYGGMSTAALEVAQSRYEAAFSTTLAYLPRASDTAEWRYLVPRLDTYYLQNPRLYGSLGSPGTRAYLGLRSLLRRLRGST